MSYAADNIPDDKNRALVGRVAPRPPHRESPWQQATADEMMVLMWSVVLCMSEYDYLVPTLLAMAANGFDRRSTIDYLRRRRCCTKSAARRLYELHRTLLGAIFVSTNKDGGFLDLSKIPFRILSPIYIEGDDARKGNQK